MESHAARPASAVQAAVGRLVVPSPPRRWRPRAPGAVAGLLAVALGLAGLVPGCGHRQTMQEVALRHGGRDRGAWLLRPDGPVAGRPLLLLLHGGAGSGRRLARHLHTQVDRLRRERGWVVAFPDGVGHSWNDGRRDVDATAHREGVDDVGYLRALVRDLVRRLGVDPARVYVAGISNGGFMAQRLACEASDAFAGAVSVTAQLSVDLAARCRPVRPIAVALINGTRDPIVPHDGGNVSVLGTSRGAIWSTEATVAFWRERNGCEGPPTEFDHAPTEPDDPTRAHGRIWRNCRGAPVGLLRVEGGGHAWPGVAQALPTSMVGRASGAVDALAWIAAFLADERR